MSKVRPVIRLTLVVCLLFSAGLADAGANTCGAAARAQLPETLWMKPVTERRELEKDLQQEDSRPEITSADVPAEFRDSQLAAELAKP
ncbi:MAG TPA: hypothetical protein VFV50_03760, partial [Bdellovibrionales bacterium]|nr:hypothetical protein [Bdellovibrionales bacterium]